MKTLQLSLQDVGPGVPIEVPAGPGIDIAWRDPSTLLGALRLPKAPELQRREVAEQVFVIVLGASGGSASASLFGDGGVVCADDVEDHGADYVLRFCCRVDLPMPGACALHLCCMGRVSNVLWLARAAP